MNVDSYDRAMSSKLRSITAPAGFTAAGGTFGIKRSGKPDMAMIVSDAPCRAAAVFTRNAIPSNPVLLNRAHIADGRCRAIVCNSGVANASTGRTGYRNAQAMAASVAKHIGCDATEVLVCSTGVIGQQLPMGKITAGIEALSRQLSAGARPDAEAAHAIMTTDLKPKAAMRKVTIGGKAVRIGGIAKGSGMIAPNLATMLGFITTDASVSLPMLRASLVEAVNADASFNRISVDSDTSPSDSVIVLANGRADHAMIRQRDAAYRKFVAALTEVCRDLAYQIIADGEGVEHVIRVAVRRAKTNDDAMKVARSVADSPLVKTAVHGGDPNWGRLTMAVGKSGAAVTADKLTIRIGPVIVYRRGGPADFREADVAALMKKPEVVVTIDLNLGKGRCEFLGCDLSRQYVAINADYHT